jgi:hypothetical protein
MAEAYYGVPEDLVKECEKRITPEMKAVLEKFRNTIRTSRPE